MKKYRIRIPEVHYTTLELEADSEEAAREEANKAIEAGLFDQYNMEYSHTLDVDEWPVTEIK